MVCWITDGSSGFTIKGNVVTHADDRGVDNVFNAMWRDGDGVASGEHYWKIQFHTLSHGAGVGFTSKDHFKQGYACNAIKYLGNLSNGSGLLVGKFGPSPKAGDIIGILAVFVGDRLQMYIDLNQQSLGLAFDVPASTFKSIYPVVAFHKSGSATCTKESKIPNIRVRAPDDFTGIEGDWKLGYFEEKRIDPERFKQSGIDSEFLVVPTSTITKSGPYEYSWHVQMVNNLSTTLSRKDGIWKTSNSSLTMMLGTPQSLKLEYEISSLIEEVKVVELDYRGDLIIKSDRIVTSWRRYDSTPAPFVGAPFA